MYKGVKGIVRKVDELGRIIPPKEFRNVLEIKELDEVDMYLDGETLRICKAKSPAKGIVRNIDPVGRISFPVEYRRILGIKEKDPVDMYLDNEEICLKKVVTGCSICSSEEKLEDIDGVTICLDCCKKISEKYKEA